MDMLMERSSRLPGNVSRTELGRALIGLCGLGAVGLMSLLHVLIS